MSKSKNTTVKQSVMSFMKRTVNRRKSKRFNGAEVASSSTSPKTSTMRTLRHLRESGMLDYNVINSRQSLYELTSINF